MDQIEVDGLRIAYERAGAGMSSDPPERWGMAGYADCLAAFLHAIGVTRASLVGLSFGGSLALALYDRHPATAVTVTLASAYAGWTGSLSPDVAEQRLRQALDLSALSASNVVEALLPTMFSPSVAPEDVAAFEASMRDFHPAGFRAMARAANKDLRHVLPTVDVPTLLIYGDEDERAPMYVAEDLRASIPTDRLVTLPGVGHFCNVESPRRFNREVRNFLRANGG